jgi:hypothetical protein
MSGSGTGGKPRTATTNTVPSSWRRDVFRADADSWPEVAIDRNLIQASGQPVLDVGCATGRLVLLGVSVAPDPDVGYLYIEEMVEVGTRESEVISDYLPECPLLAIDT